MGSVMTSLVTERSPEPGIWQVVFKNVWWILTKLPLGEGSYPWLQLRHPINLHKGLSLPFCLLCMYLSDNWSYPACIYTAAHGTYGITWLLKEYLYRDSSWETSCTLGSALLLVFGMGSGFWVNMVLVVSEGGRYAPSPPTVCLIMIIFTLGIWLHHTADAQVGPGRRRRK